MKTEVFPVKVLSDGTIVTDYTRRLLPSKDKVRLRRDKIIQYMAAGKPALVSPVGIAHDLVAHGESGFHCTTEDQWYDSLMQLHQDSALCASMGANAQSQAQDKYDTEIAANRLCKVFVSCMGG